MFSKVLTVCLVLYTVQVLGGSIKPKLSPEVQNVVQQIDLKALLLENDIKTASTEKKHAMDMVKLNTKMALKQLKTAIKEGKGTLCGQVANLQSRAVEQRANELKLCNNKLNLKELQQDLHGYLKNLHEEAMLVDKYCAFITTDSAEIAKCVTDSVAAMEAKLNDVETVISVGLGNHRNESAQCFNSIVDDVQLECGRIQLELADCLNPTTAAPVETEAPAKDDSSSSSESKSSESSESKESNESNSGSQEVSEGPSVSETEDGNNGNNGGEDDDTEQTSDASNNGEEGNSGESSTAGDDQEGGDNDGETTVDDNEEETSDKTETEEPAKEETPNEDENESGDGEVPAEEKPAEEIPNEEAPVEETPSEETPVKEPSNEETPAEETPVEETPVEEAPVEEVAIKEAEPNQPIVLKDDDEINIEY
ncbi:uncharacterized protein [Atheta coriaria]|uniref:uncharacterized protein n=1 Tax=Dalotia coriaria TaxID=877792 RepID=UPI0031F3BD93